jgi:predicted Rossmann fold flavoprotein
MKYFFINFVMFFSLSLYRRKDYQRKSMISSKKIEQQLSFDTIVVGGGAAGFFAALTARQKNPAASLLLLERTAALLSKVRISGGGRCNVTHACFDPRLLAQNYPRGGKELIGPFTRFQPRDTVHWFESRGVALKTEEDGRLFPVSDSSSTIIDCLLQEAKKLKVEIRTQQRLSQIERGFALTLASGEQLECRHLCLATGSHPDGHAFAKALGHTLQPPVPSLFTFNIPAFALKDLAGISLEAVSLSLLDQTQRGALLITHWGFSGPAALKLSAWAARPLHACGYRAPLFVDWLPDQKKEALIALLHQKRRDVPTQSLASHNPFHLPKNLWRRLLSLSGLEETKRFSEISNEACARLAERLKGDCYQVEGKTTHKEEFVTCGGVSLSEVNFKTMESRLCPGLFFAGEILDIDAVTGGFNFQNAWTTGWLAGQSL